MADIPARGRTESDDAYQESYQEKPDPDEPLQPWDNCGPWITKDDLLRYLVALSEKKDEDPREYYFMNIYIENRRSDMTDWIRKHALPAPSGQVRKPGWNWKYIKDKVQDNDTEKYKERSFTNLYVGRFKEVSEVNAERLRIHEMLRKEDGRKASEASEGSKGLQRPHIVLSAAMRYDEDYLELLAGEGQDWPKKENPQ